MTFEDKDYLEKMNTLVLPFLRLNLENGSFDSFDGAKINYCYIKNPIGKATIVISHGFCEFIPKYYEMFYYMYQEGYSVYMLEHRGHGYSQRFVDDLDMVYVGSFLDYVEDLKLFVEEIVKPQQKFSRIYLYGHSMGGGISALFLEKYPDIFDKAVLSSPMISINFKKIPKHWVKAAMALSKVLRWDKKYVPGNHGFREKRKASKGTAMSEPRYDFYCDYRLKDKHYRTYGASFKWAREAVALTKKIKKNVSRIHIPVLLCQSGDETLVDNSAQDYLVEKSEYITKIEYPNAKHQLYNATKEIRDKFYHDIFNFFEQK